VPVYHRSEKKKKKEKKKGRARMHVWVITILQ